MTAFPKTAPLKTAEDRIPGDLTKDQLIARILRVDQAGELGAVHIYQGQRAVLGKGRHGAMLSKMHDQEKHHLETFNRLIGQRKVRPTVLAPLWHVAGFALGAGTALLGERAAMACTVAVEEAIDEHYADQAAKLGDDEAELRATIETFRQEEIEHRDIALANEAEKAPGYPVLSAAIKTGCKVAIWLSERV
jgi:ubiquinone biosynthesis monooxygenase Coq7